MAETAYDGIRNKKGSPIMRRIAQKTTVLLLALALSLSLLLNPAAAITPGGSSIEDPLLWLSSQLTEEGSVIYSYFLSRKAGSSLDFTGFNHAPGVNAKLADAGYASFSYRIYKNADGSFCLY